MGADQWVITAVLAAGLTVGYISGHAIGRDVRRSRAAHPAGKGRAADPTTLATLAVWLNAHLERIPTGSRMFIEFHRKADDHVSGEVIHAGFGEVGIATEEET